MKSGRRRRCPVSGHGGAVPWRRWPVGRGVVASGGAQDGVWEAAAQCGVWESSCRPASAVCEAARKLGDGATGAACGERESEGK
jgi:hypothetical protein